MSVYKQPDSNFNPLLNLLKIEGILVRQNTAFAIARLLLIEMYDEDMVKYHEPLSIKEEDDHWVVEGIGKDSRYTAMIALAKSDARVVDIAVFAPMIRESE